MRRSLIAVIGALSLVAVATAPVPGWAVLFGAVLVVAVAGRALRRAPGAHRVERIEGGRIRLRTPAGSCLHGAVEPAYSSGFFCAFTVHDPVAGSRRFGLFRDELDPEGWRRLRVALRAGGEA